MAIVGVTHEKDGRAKLSRTVTTKVAIGLPPTGNSNFPQRLDHFVFLKKIQVQKEIKWVTDEELTKHYGQNPREFWVVFLDDDPDQVFRTEYAAFVKRGRWCCGDGVQAQRRNLGPDGTSWGPLEIYKGPCAENGCREFEAGKCAPSGDLYFMLADFPTLGTVCRIHTSSYQSVRQIYSALQELHRVTGGRLMGVRAKLFVAPDKNLYEDNQGKTVTGIKWVLGLQLAAKDLADFSSKMLETAKTFQQIKGQLNGQVLEIVEDEEERGAELVAEFYPDAKEQPPAEDPEKQLRAECDQLMERHGVNKATREQKLEQWRGRMGEALERLKAQDRARQQQNSTVITNSPPPPASEPPLQETPSVAPAVSSQRSSKPNGKWSF